MSFKKQVFAQAMRIIEQRAQDAKITAAAHEMEMREKLPTIFTMRKELSQTAANIGKAIFTSHGAVKEVIEELKQRNIFIQQRIVDELCDNGYPANYLTVNYQCDVCRDTGFVGNQKCNCLKVIESKLMIARLSACSTLDNCNFENYSLDFYTDKPVGDKPSSRATMSRIYNYCLNYAESFTMSSDSILLFGGTGLGKTHLSLSIAGRVLEKGYSVLYSSAQDFLRMVEDEHFGRANSNSDTLEELIESELLIIDDLGVEFASEFNVSTIHNIINTRLSMRRPTIINTNLGAAEIEKKYSARIVSRIFSSYSCLRCEGTDVRILKAQTERKKQY